MRKYPKATLVTPTYNWPEALDLLLLSLTRQTYMPDEIIIADDGSKEETKQIIESYKDKFSVPLIHIWHEDDGNRKPMIMNKAIARATGDYIIEIDGDIIMEKHFVEDHLRFAEKGAYLYGSRVNIKQDKLADLFKQRITSFNFFSGGIKKRGRTLRFPLAMRFVKKVEERSKKLRGCNMSFWKKDFIAINGFNENLRGWGIDDSEMIQRLHNLGIKGKRLKNSGIAFHIYHKEQSRTLVDFNKQIEEETTKNKITYIDKGVGQYL